jgi:hypothetical protein
MVQHEVGEPESPHRLPDQLFSGVIGDTHTTHREEPWLQRASQR